MSATSYVIDTGNLVTRFLTELAEIGIDDREIDVNVTIYNYLCIELANQCAIRLASCGADFHQQVTTVPEMTCLHSFKEFLFEPLRSNFQKYAKIFIYELWLLIKTHVPVDPAKLYLVHAINKRYLVLVCLDGQDGPLRLTYNAPSD